MNETVIALSPTPYFKFLVIRTTKNITVYEPKMNLFYNSYPVGPESKGITTYMGSQVVEFLRQSDCLTVESFYQEEMERGDIIWNLEDFKRKFSQAAAYKTIVTSVDNVESTSEESMYNSMPSSLKIQVVIEIMDRRAKARKIFFDKFQKENPHFLKILYAHNPRGGDKGGQ